MAPRKPRERVGRRIHSRNPPGPLAWSVSGEVTLGLGLLVSTISDNQKQSQQTAMLIMLIGLVLGGFMFPRYLMPPFIRILGNLFPLTYFIPIARGIVTKGIGVAALWEHIAALVAYVVLVMGLAIWAFNPKLG